MSEYKTPSPVQEYQGWTARVFEFLSRLGFWMLLAYIVMSAMLVFTVWIDTHAAKTETLRAAAISRCTASRPILKNFQTHIRGVSALALALVENAAATVEATPANDPQHEVRRRNLIRLLFAREAINELPDIRVPTVKQCKGMQP